MDTHSTALRAPAHTTANYQAAIDAVKAYKESISLRTKAGEAYYEKTAERDHADRVLQAEGAKLAILMRKMWRLESYETIVLNDSSIRRTMDQARAEMQEAAEMEVEEVKATLHKHPHIESLGMTTKGGTDEENVILGTYAFVVAKACDAPEGKVSMHIVRMPNGMWVYHREPCFEGCMYGDTERGMSLRRRLFHIATGEDGNLLHWCPTHMPTPTASDPTKLRYQPRRLVPTAHEYPSLKALIINIADQSTRPTRPTAVPRRFDTTMSF